MKRIVVLMLLMGLLVFGTSVAGVYGESELVETTEEGYRYALKFPESYGDGGDYPVLFSFHHRGDGIEAIRIFGYAQFQLNWIIVGLMDLNFADLNQEAWKEIIVVQEAVLKDVLEKYSVNDKKFFTAGFSHGATMALTMAYAHPKQFRGVLAFSGDFGLGEPARNIPVYFAVGNDDYKLVDVKNAYNYLTDAGIAATLHVFEGGHQWPETRIINSSLGWIKGRAR